MTFLETLKFSTHYSLLISVLPRVSTQNLVLPLSLGKQRCNRCNWYGRRKRKDNSSSPINS